MCLFGRWDDRMVLLRQSMRLNETYPDWFHGPIVLFHYRRNDYAKAYDEALKYSVPHKSWGPMLRIATLGQLKRASDAQSDCAPLFELRPHFRERGNALIRRYVKEEDLAKYLVEGLDKAGVVLRNT